MSRITPIPTRAPLFAEPAGRAGDWWEPIPVGAAEVAVALAPDANRLRLPLDLLVALLVEHALVVSDIMECGGDFPHARTALAAAAAQEPTVGPGCLHTAYVRMLRLGVSGYERESEGELCRRDLMVPLRLHHAASAIDIVETCQRSSVDEGITWEITAASSGQFMREWALRVLLADFAA